MTRAEQLWREAVKDRTGTYPSKHEWNDLPGWIQDSWREKAEREAEQNASRNS